MRYTGIDLALSASDVSICMRVVGPCTVMAVHITWPHVCGRRAMLGPYGFMLHVIVVVVVPADAAVGTRSTTTTTTTTRAAGAGSTAAAGADSGGVGDIDAVGAMQAAAADEAPEGVGCEVEVHWRYGVCECVRSLRGGAGQKK